MSNEIKIPDEVTKEIDKLINLIVMQDEVIKSNQKLISAYEKELDRLKTISRNGVQVNLIVMNQ